MRRDRGPWSPASPACEPSSGPVASSKARPGTKPPHRETRGPGEEVRPGNRQLRWPAGAATWAATCSPAHVGTRLAPEAAGALGDGPGVPPGSGPVPGAREPHTNPAGGGRPGPGPPMHAWRPVSEASVRKGLPLGWDSTPGDGFASWRGRFLPHGVCTMSAWDGKVLSVSAGRSLTGTLPRTPVAHGHRICP